MAKFSWLSGLILFNAILSYAEPNMNELMLDVTVYAGAKRIDFHHNHHLKYSFPVSLNSQYSPETWDRQKVEGENQVVVFEVPSTVTSSTASVFDALVGELSAMGAKTHIMCSGITASCGFYFPRRLGLYEPKRGYYKKMSAFWNLNVGDFHMYTGALTTLDEQYYIGVVVAKLDNDPIQYSVDILRKSSPPKITLSSRKDKNNDISVAIENAGYALLEGIYFDVDKTDLKPSSYPALEAIAEYLREKKNSSFLVVGHTDSTGDAEYNVALSFSRAESIVNQLVKNFSIPFEQISARGDGMTKPIASNDTVEGRSKNRRVELVLVDGNLDQKNSSEFVESAPLE